MNLIDCIGKEEQQAQKRLLRGVRGAASIHSLTSAFTRQETPLSSSRLWSVPFSCNPLFTGREDLLEHLHQQLTAGGLTSNATTAVLLR